MMAAWAFIILMQIPTFGGSVLVEFRTTTEDGCQRLRKVIVREMDNMRMKFDAGECALFGIE